MTEWRSRIAQPPFPFAARSGYGMLEGEGQAMIRPAHSLLVALCLLALVTSVAACGYVLLAEMDTVFTIRGGFLDSHMILATAFFFCSGLASMFWPQLWARLELRQVSSCPPEEDTDRLAKARQIDVISTFFLWIGAGTVFAGFVLIASLFVEGGPRARLARVYGVIPIVLCFIAGIAEGIRSWIRWTRWKRAWDQQGRGNT